jgi:hypothetical protein
MLHELLWEGLYSLGMRRKVLPPPVSQAQNRVYCWNRCSVTCWITSVTFLGSLICVLLVCPCYWIALSLNYEHLKYCHLDIAITDIEAVNKGVIWQFSTGNCIWQHGWRCTDPSILPKGHHSSPVSAETISLVENTGQIVEKVLPQSKLLVVIPLDTYWPMQGDVFDPDRLSATIRGIIELGQSDRSICIVIIMYTTQESHDIMNVESAREFVRTAHAGGRSNDFIRNNEADWLQLHLTLMFMYIMTERGTPVFHQIGLKAFQMRADLLIVLPTNEATQRQPSLLDKDINYVKRQMKRIDVTSAGEMCQERRLSETCGLVASGKMLEDTNGVIPLDLQYGRT